MQASLRAALGAPARLRQAWNRTLQAIVPVVSAQQPGTQVPVRVGGNIKAPRKVRDARPVCPQPPIPATDTSVTLSGRIDADGYFREVARNADKPEAAPPVRFLESALDAVRQWSFTPALLNGTPIEVNITIHVLYRRT